VQKIVKNESKSVEPTIKSPNNKSEYISKFNSPKGLLRERSEQNLKIKQNNNNFLTDRKLLSNITPSNSNLTSKNNSITVNNKKNNQVVSSFRSKYNSDNKSLENKKRTIDKIETNINTNIATNKQIKSPLYNNNSFKNSSSCNKNGNNNKQQGKLDNNNINIKPNMSNIVRPKIN